MPCPTARHIKIKVFEVSKLNMCAMVKRYRSYHGKESDKQMVRQLLSSPLSEIIKLSYEYYYLYLGVSVINFADFDPHLMVCQVHSSDQAVLTFRFDAPLPRPSGADKPMPCGDAEPDVDLYSTSC